MSYNKINEDAFIKTNIVQNGIKLDYIISSDKNINSINNFQTPFDNRIQLHYMDDSIEGQRGCELLYGINPINKDLLIYITPTSPTILDWLVNLLVLKVKVYSFDKAILNDIKRSSKKKKLMMKNDVKYKYKVHGGFYLYATRVYNNVKELVIEHGKLYKNSKTIISGHSQGGAVAQILTFMLCNDNYSHRIGALNLLGTAKVLNREMRKELIKYTFPINIISRYYDYVTWLPFFYSNFKRDEVNYYKLKLPFYRIFTPFKNHDYYKKNEFILCLNKKFKK